MKCNVHERCLSCRIKWGPPTSWAGQFGALTIEKDEKFERRGSKEKGKGKMWLLGSDQ